MRRALRSLGPGGRLARLLAGLACSAAVAAARAADVERVETDVETAVERVAGAVYLDADADGTRDADERPLAGIRITDGVGFATTDERGRFAIDVAADVQIPYAPARVVSVSWPSGFWPVGRWWRRLSELAPGAEVAFGLREDRRPLPFVFAQVGDCHGEAAPFRADGPFARLFTDQFGPALRFCVHAGDYGYCSPEVMDSMFDAVVRNTRDFPVPMFFNVGNHDLVGRTAESWRLPRHGYWGFTRRLGPVRWSFSAGGAHFAAVDWADISSGAYREGVPDVAAAWLDRDLAAQPAGTRSFVFAHHPSGGAAFVDALVRHDVRHVFGGHTHAFKEYLLGGRVSGTTVLNAASVAAAAVVVREDGHDLVHYCGGCKHGPRYHGKRCAVGMKQPCFAAWSARRRGAAAELADVRLDDATRTLDAGGGAGVEIVVAIRPGTARRVGLRLGRERTVEVAFESGRTLRVADSAVPFVPRDDAGVHWHLAVEEGRLTIFADDLLRFARAVDVDEPAVVELFAAGGEATVTAGAWSLAAPP